MMRDLRLLLWLVVTSTISSSSTTAFQIQPFLSVWKQQSSRRQAPSSSFFYPLPQWMSKDDLTSEDSTTRTALNKNALFVSSTTNDDDEEEDRKDDVSRTTVGVMMDANTNTKETAAAAGNNNGNKNNKLLEEAQLLKMQAEKVRLEADKMDTILTLDKITKLEQQLSKLSSNNNNDSNDTAAAAAEEKESIQKQLAVLQKRLEPPTPTTTPTTVKEEEEDSESLLMLFPPISERELKERMEAFERSPEILRSMTAQAAGIEDVTNVEGIVKKMYEDEQMMKRKKELAKEGKLEPLSEEAKREALEGFLKLPLPIQDMIAKSVNINMNHSKDNTTNATATAVAVIEKLAAENRLFEDSSGNGGSGGFEVDTEVMDLFTEDFEFSETSRYVMSLLPESTRKTNQTPTDEDIDTFFATCLGKRTFNAVSKPERIPGGVIIRGENKMKTPNELVDALEDKLSNQPSIANTLQFYFIRDPTPPRSDNDDSSMMMEQDAFETPLLVVTGKDLSPTTNPLVKPITSTLGLISIAAFSLGAYSFNTNLVDQLSTDIQNGNDISWFTDLSTQLFLSIFLTQLAHEAAHQFVALKDKFRAGFPTIVPSLQLGFQTSITPLITPPKNFQSLFDFALAGPLVGMCISVLLMYVGLEQQVFMDAQSSSQPYYYLPALPVELIRSSSLAGGIIEWLLGDAGILLSPDPTTMIPLHPYAIAGFVGIMTNSLSLLPLGSTDGGRIATALFGRSFSRIVNGFTLLLLVLLGVFGLDNSNVFLLYALFCTFFQREPEIPMKNEIDTIDEVRGVIAIATAVLVTLALCPITI